MIPLNRYKGREPVMRSFIKLLIVLLVCLVGIGLYRGWFSFSRSSPGVEGDKINVNVSVDKVKIKSDLAKAEEKVAEEVRELEGKAKAEAAK
jgi:hypothetical protein